MGRHGAVVTAIRAAAGPAKSAAKKIEKSLILEQLNSCGAGAWLERRVKSRRAEPLQTCSSLRTRLAPPILRRANNGRLAAAITRVDRAVGGSSPGGILGHVALSVHERDGPDAEGQLGSARSVGGG